MSSGAYIGDLQYHTVTVYAPNRFHAGKPSYTVKNVIVFPVPNRDVTKQTLPGRELLNYSRPGRL
jgi:hypothetical protein